MRNSSQIQDPYCYENTSVLKNKKDVRTQAKLDLLERMYTAKRLYELSVHPIQGDFTLAHFSKIHHYIFQDLYEFAGKIRTVNIGKGIQFCAVPYIDSYFQDVVSESLRKQNYLKGLKKQEFVEKAATLFAEVNAVHPFREGNGRAQREYFRCIALASGYTLHWELTTEEEMIQASKQSAIGSIAGLIGIFERIIRVVPGTTRIRSKELESQVNGVNNDEH